MTHFITREDLLQWLERHCTRKAVIRALQEGTVEHLGAFTKLGPNGKPGWIVQVTSEQNCMWDIEVATDPIQRRYSIFIQYSKHNHILWEHWNETVFSTPVNPLYDGDDPTKYARLRDERRAEIAKQNRATKNTKPEPESEGEGA